MITNQTEIRSVVQRCFVQRTAGPLLELLGFSADGAPATPMAKSVHAERCSYHGSRGVLAAYSFQSEQPLPLSDVARISRAARMHNPAQLQLYLFVDSSYRRIILGSFGIGSDLLTLRLDCDRLHGSDIETLHEMIPRRDEDGVALAALHARALDRARVTQLFFADFAAHRYMIAEAWRGIPEDRHEARGQLALLLLSRLMFLYFLQHRNHLGDDPAYLARRLRAWSRVRHDSTFYRSTLRPLFFYVLNRQPALRPAAARKFGSLPYLNGGLFDRHYLERQFRRLDLPDPCIAAVFDNLLERYRFTASEASDAEADGVKDVGVDPEMLGRVFEGLMAERTRETTGTFYTPARTVDHLVCESLATYLAPRLGEERAHAVIRNADASALDADQRRFAGGLLERVKVLDPACGSGAFLLGSLARIANARAALGEADVLAVRRAVVSRNLFGVDLQNDAAQLCSLRLWLALVPAEAQQKPQPLPNLDRQIRQGDSLVDAIDLRAGTADTSVMRCITQLTTTNHQYAHADPKQRSGLLRSLQSGERALARAWVGALQRRIKYQAAELRSLRMQKDLFGERTAEARAADRAIAELAERDLELKRVARAVKSQDGKPFFSFAVHFADAAINGFDVVICNPPWVRSHNWKGSVSALAKKRFEVCRAKPWRGAGLATSPGAGSQVDLALLFLERAIELLAPDGVLGIILPAKFMRSLSGAAARRLLLREMDIISLEDHSLDQRSIFQADAFACILVARKHKPCPSAKPVEVRLVKRSADALDFSLTQSSLPVIPADTGAPWLILPNAARAAVRKMFESPAVGTMSDVLVRRGIVTGANDAAIVTERALKLGSLAAIRSAGHGTAPDAQRYEAVVEESAVRPLVRGCDINAWRHKQERFVICGDGARTPRAARYLASHNCSLASVPAGENCCVAWQDISQDMAACVLPAGVVALNTAYFISLPEDTAHLLCAYFNSLPFRVAARAVAERAKDAHFRFFAWTVSLLPLPARWHTEESARLRELSRAAHLNPENCQEEQSEVDAIVGRAYGLSRSHMKALADFDTWLRSK